MKVLYVLITGVLCNVSFAMDKFEVVDYPREVVRKKLEQQRKNSFNQYAQQYERKQRNQFTEIMLNSLTKELDKAPQEQDLSVLIKKSRALADTIVQKKLGKNVMHRDAKSNTTKNDDEHKKDKSAEDRDSLENIDFEEMNDDVIIKKQEAGDSTAELSQQVINNFVHNLMQNCSGKRNAGESSMHCENQ